MRREGAEGGCEAGFGGRERRRGLSLVDGVVNARAGRTRNHGLVFTTWSRQVSHTTSQSLSFPTCKMGPACPLCSYKHGEVCVSFVRNLTTNLPAGGSLKVFPVPRVREQIWRWSFARGMFIGKRPGVNSTSPRRGGSRSGQRGKLSREAAPVTTLANPTRALQLQELEMSRCGPRGWAFTRRTLSRWGGWPGQAWLGQGGSAEGQSLRLTAAGWPGRRDTTPVPQGDPGRASPSPSHCRRVYLFPTVRLAFHLSSKRRPTSLRPL